MAYSIPTMMYHNYTYAMLRPPVSALSGIARALEEGHVPYDAVILQPSRDPRRPRDAARNSEHTAW